MTHHPKSAFPKPQFDLLPDPKGARFYANVDNRLEVSQGTRSHHVAIAVPAGLFTIMKDVFNISPTEDVTLALDVIDDRYVLSMMWAGDQLADLWTYSPGSLPPWIVSPVHRL